MFHIPNKLSNTPKKVTHKTKGLSSHNNRYNTHTSKVTPYLTKGLKGCASDTQHTIRQAAKSNTGKKMIEYRKDIVFQVLTHHKIHYEK